MFVKYCDIFQKKNTCPELALEPVFLVHTEKDIINKNKVLIRYFVIEAYLNCMEVTAWVSRYLWHH